MQKKFRISVDGRSYNVVVDDISDAGEPRAQPRPAPVAATPAPTAAPAPVAAPPPPAAAAASTGAEVAPLAGVVVSIDVKTGETVKAGDKIATIEAMKMKTEIVAKHTGTVTNILVRPSDAVETGQALLNIA